MKTVGGAIIASIVTVGAVIHAQSPIDDVDALRRAFQAAQPGDVLVLEPGSYVVDVELSTLCVRTAEQPITVQAAANGESVIRFTRIDAGYVEGFKVQHPRWIFKGLSLDGQSHDHSRCEHTWHIIGDADCTNIRINTVRDFNAYIKANRQSGDEAA